MGQEGLILCEPTPKPEVAQDLSFSEEILESVPEAPPVELPPRTAQYEKAQTAFEIGLYYNYFTEPDEYDEETLANHMPTPHNAWIHLSCAFWIQEVSFNAHRTRINNFENINAKRWTLKCEVCKKENRGACVQCPTDKCTLAFHPECARRANLGLEYR